jgi:hypothetical protein
MCTVCSIIAYLGSFKHTQNDMHIRVDWFFLKRHFLEMASY